MKKRIAAQSKPSSRKVHMTTQLEGRVVHIHDPGDRSCRPGKIALAVVAGALMLAAGIGGADAANCNLMGGIGFHALKEKQVKFFTRKDTPCTLTFGRVQFAAFSQTVVKRPRGLYGTADKISGAYQPPTGFVGDDYFEILLDYQRLGDPQRYRTLLKITMKVAG